MTGRSTFYVNLLFIAIGGALGSVARYLLSVSVARLAASPFPYGTFVVNVVGCIAFGAIVGALERGVAVTPQARALLLTGLLGGFTTFSAFTFETFVLVRDGHVAMAALNVAGQIVAGLAGLWAASALFAGR